MSLTLIPPSLPPPPLRKMHLWRIYCLTAMNGPLPAELKFRENAVYVPNYNFCPLREKNMMVVRQMFGAVVLFCMLC